MKEKKVKTIIVAVLLATAIASPSNAQSSACVAEARSALGSQYNLDRLMKYMDEHPSCGRAQVERRQEQERQEREAKFNAISRGEISYCEAFKSELQGFLTGIQSGNPCLK